MPDVLLLLNVMLLFLAVPWVGLQCAIVLFLDHTCLLLEAMTTKIIHSTALFGTYCIPFNK